MIRTLVYGTIMSKIVQLDVYRHTLAQRTRQQLNITGFDVVGKNHIEVVIDDGGEVKVLQIKRKSDETNFWTCRSMLLEEVIAEVLSEDSSDDADS